LHPGVPSQESVAQATRPGSVPTSIGFLFVGHGCICQVHISTRQWLTMNDHEHERELHSCGEFQKSGQTNINSKYQRKTKGKMKQAIAGLITFATQRFVIHTILFPHPACFLLASSFTFSPHVVYNPSSCQSYPFAPPISTSFPRHRVSSVSSPT
jgi:hypothetical protein